MPGLVSLPALGLAAVALVACSPAPAGDELCTRSGKTVSCRSQPFTLSDGRVVRHQQPLGEPPVAGWPAVVVFQGSFHPAPWMWAATDGAAFGADHQTATLRALLEAGFVVVTPEARLGGSSFWDTNVPPWAHDWAAAPDHVMMTALFAALEAGDLGPVNLSRLYAAGISSGGYMTSRMAVAYPSRFRALAVHSASFATCAGALCVLPSALPADHPPTLFLHGVADPVVPFGTMRLYRDALKDQGTEVAEVLEPQAGHAWLAAAPEAVRDFFLSH